MRRVETLLLSALTLFCLCAVPIAQPASLAPDNFDFKTLLGDPPVDGSDIQKSEIETMLNLQSSRTAEEVARCKAEEKGTPFVFSSVLGKWFNADDLPMSAEFFKEVTHQTKIVSGAAKLSWSRKRPFLADPRIKPCLTPEDTFSYPSGHATRGMVWGILLAEIFPEHREALIARGELFGTDRTLAGEHYPTDVKAGQKLGAEIAKRMLADAGIHAHLEKVKQECLAHEPK